MVVAFAPPLLMLALVSTGMVESGPRVTSDTIEYCGSLAERVAALPPAAVEPYRSLAAEGVRLCRNGHVRTGIAKLRRVMKATQAAP